jgi:hypothetical protein
MDATSGIRPLADRDIYYYRQRQKNRVFTDIVAFFVEEAERTGITKRDIAESLKKDPAQITRWLSAPSNLTLDSISDLLLSLGAELDYRVCRFADRAKPNAAHPAIVEYLSGSYSPPSVTVAEIDYDQEPTLAPAVTGASKSEPWRVGETA